MAKAFPDQYTDKHIEARERAWQQQLEERRRRKAEQPPEQQQAEPDEVNEENRAPLAIEAPPTAPPVDLRNLQAQNETEPMVASAMPVPDITFDHSNYSENV